MLYGRAQERALIAGLLAGAREGRAGVLVVRGEAGVGKHALLADAAEQASGFLLLRCSGAEAEAALPFAGLQQLLWPVLDRLDQIPTPQALALQGAFGLAETRTGTNRFLVELGALSLLATVAAKQPLLCLVAQARWLDPASTDALVFVARRLEHEPIVMLFAVREGEARQFQAASLPEVQVGGLDATAAGQLLAAHAGPLAPQVRERLTAEAGGNPLALLELPRRLSSQQLAGLAPLPARFRLTPRLEQVFLERVRQLPQATQTLLLVGAAEDTGELATILAAGAVLGIDPGALAAAERAGLVQVVASRLVFRHPLVRSAIYQAAKMVARRATHRALVQVLQRAQQADRRAWHQAAATLHPDEQVAAALEASAEQAHRRGGPTAAAAALERAATLSGRPDVWARRLVAAAEYRWEAGHTEQATALLDRIRRGPADPIVRARASHVRGAIELAAGTPAIACELLVDGAGLIQGSDPRRATEMLVLAAWAALSAGRLDRLVQEIGPAIARLPGHDPRVQRVADSLVTAGLVAGPPDAGTPTASATEAAGWPHPSLSWVWPMLIMAEPTGGQLTADAAYARSVAARRAAGTVSGLTVALANLALAEAFLGRWPGAIRTATQGLQLANETGQHATASHFVVMLAGFAAHQGRADDCRRLAEEALATATRLRLASVAAYTAWMLGLLELTQGRPAAALERLRPLSIPHHPAANPAIALLATRELVEAAARAGRLEGMEAHVARLERWAEADRRTWTREIARRSRALISHGEEAERHFRAALAVEGIRELPHELARTELLYGEWLRRERRRAEARTHLRVALELFERLDGGAWVRRARSELRASGETARKRDPSTLGQLTTRERQVARLAGQGLTNQQIAERLFVSRHTIGYHLHKVYAKLGITSRAELAQLDLDDDAR